ncbi:hypothetical protein CW752_12320 [Chryseobacterium sp. PMSZPI]|nr:hypothetical protein CW752_12320 [Chryseobacterium sp. PMSZPI]
MGAFLLSCLSIEKDLLLILKFQVWAKAYGRFLFIKWAKAHFYRSSKSFTFYLIIKKTVKPDSL